MECKFYNNDPNYLWFRLSSLVLPFNVYYHKIQVFVKSTILVIKSFHRIEKNYEMNILTTTHVMMQNFCLNEKKALLYAMETFIWEIYHNSKVTYILTQNRITHHQIIRALQTRSGKRIPNIRANKFQRFLLSGIPYLCIIIEDRKAKFYNNCLKNFGVFFLDIY